MRPLRALILGLAALALLATAVLYAAGRGVLGRFDSETLAPRAPARAVPPPEQGEAKQILFGDLHVHTTISFDAFMLNLPLMGGEGAHPPADACDFARHCAALDFWSINDHAANIHPEDWRNTIESIRQCNARAGDPANPDLVAFLGWEWTQAGQTPEEHYGHKNVVLAHTDDARIPSRPIAASAGGTAALPPPVLARGALALTGARYRDLARRWTALGELPLCAVGPVRELPPGCREIAATPAALFEKLDDWGHDALVIPHGTSWGIYTPPGSSWDKQLRGPMHHPRQSLIEVYSGHGASEVHRSWRAVEPGAEGAPRCPPEERGDYLPMCQRAGEIVAARCEAEGGSPADCAARTDEARSNAARAAVSPHATVPGASGADWLDAGQCRDCSQPAFHYRPGGSAQYIAALGSFDEPGAPRRFRMGFIGSSDIHNARAGTGYKEQRWLTDAGNAAAESGGGIVASFLQGPAEPAASRSRTIEEAREVLSGLQLYESERAQSFLYTGGLVALHSPGRNREALWDALERREVYGTSGPRILLWFDLLEAGTRWPMGSEVRVSGPPQFEVRAVGSFEQQPGCPDAAADALGPDRLAALCRNECHHPGDERRPIRRIEIVRIRPQQHPGEPIETLIDDPWLRHECPPDPAGCRLRFQDDSFSRESLYYARVFEPPLPTVNGDPLRCERDASGRCTRSQPCERGQQCLTPAPPRAWSSPLYLTPN